MVMNAKNVKMNDMLMTEQPPPPAMHQTVVVDNVPPPYVRSNKPPIYTSDKRAKFTQRENKQ